MGVIGELGSVVLEIDGVVYVMLYEVLYIDDGVVAAVIGVAGNDSE